MYVVKEFLLEDCRVRAIESPGHSVDHFTFYLDEETSLFSGDCLLGGTSTVIENLNQYIQSMRLLVKLTM